jgi:hypothetical protein
MSDEDIDGTNDEAIRRRLLRFRDATAGVEAPAPVLARLLHGVPRRARLRRFVRDARAGLLAAAIAGAGSGLWAHVEQRQLERDMYVHVGAWADAP